jgi:integrase
MRLRGKLSAADVAKRLPRGRYGDGQNLWLQVSKSGTKAWIFRYRWHGKPRHMGLGSARTVSLTQARERTRACRNLLLDDIDPLEARRAKRKGSQAEAERAQIEAARAITFRECAEAFIAEHQTGWKNKKHREQWRSSLERCVFPVFGEIPVSAIDTGVVIKALQPMWHRTPETAARVRGRIESVLEWAKVRGHRAGENPARWRGHLEHTLAARAKIAPVRHHPALPYAELPAFMVALRQCEGIAPRALEFTILTAARTNEVTAARWPEVNFLECCWTRPPEHMKGNREHRVPLSKRALDILAELPREDDQGFLFIGARPRAGLSNMAMLETLHRMGCNDITVHGFRSTFRDWAAESTNYPREVVEMALAHAIEDETEAAYRRGDLFKKRARLMEAWAGYCARRTPARTAEAPLLDVIPIGGRK